MNPTWTFSIGPDATRILTHEAKLHPRWADVQNRAGLVHLLERRLPEALACFEVCLEINPQYAWAGLNHVQTLALLGSFDQARAALNRCATPTPWLDRFASAFISWHEGDLARAMDELAALEPIIRSRREVRRLAFCLHLTSGLPGANAIGDELSPDEVTAWEQLLPREAHTDGLRAGITLVPGMHQLLVLAGRLNARLGHTELAARLASIQPLLWDEPSVTLNQRAVLADIADLPAEAERLWQDSARANPEEPEAHMHLAYHFSAAGELERAFDSIRAALRRAPRFADLQYQLGLLHTAFERHSEALAAFDAALKINPRYAMARLERAMTLFRLQRWAEARTAFNVVLDSGMDSSDLRLHVGEIERRLDAPDAALPHFRRALELSPRSADAHWNLAEALLTAGHPGDARPHWRRVTELEAGSERAATATNRLKEHSKSKRSNARGDRSHG